MVKNILIVCTGITKQLFGKGYFELCDIFNAEQRPCDTQCKMHAGIFPTFFQQPVNGSKNSVLTWIVKLSLSICFLFCFLFNKILFKEFSLDSPILLILWVRLESVYISSQIFFEIPHKTLKFQEKSWKNTFSSDLET